MASALGAVTAFGQPGDPASAKGDVLVYFGTYTGEKSKGIYVSRLDAGSGALSTPQLVAETPNPSYLAVHPTNDFLYAVNEVRSFDDQDTGSVSAFAIDRSSGKLTPLNQQASAGGGPAYLVVDKSGRHVLVANYGGGSVAALPIASDGTLKPASAFVQHTGSFSTADAQVHPTGKFLYGSNRGHDSIVVFAIDQETGRLTYVENRSTEGSTPRGFGIDPSGRYLLAANQRSDSVVVFRIDQQNGRLTPAGHTIDVGSPVCVKFVTR
ncbi:MAG: lactonase family protein [Acidobacteria bacterium]|nr:lactonase family protein [Acidobacteriota bacterium]